MTPAERARRVVGALSLQSAWWLSDAMAAQIHEECCLAIAAAVADEREACAKIAERGPANLMEENDGTTYADAIAAEIRARA